MIGAKKWEGPGGNEHDGPVLYRNIKRYGVDITYRISGPARVAGEFRIHLPERDWKEAVIDLAANEGGDEGAGSGRVIWSYIDHDGERKRNVEIELSRVQIDSQVIKMLGKVTSDDYGTDIGYWYGIIIQSDGTNGMRSMGWLRKDEKSSLIDQQGMSFSWEEARGKSQVPVGALDIN